MKVVFNSKKKVDDDDHSQRSYRYLIDNFTHDVVYNTIPNDDDYVGVFIDSDNGEKYIGFRYYWLYFEPLRDVNLNKLS